MILKIKIPQNTNSKNKNSENNNSENKNSEYKNSENKNSEKKIPKMKNPKIKFPKIIIPKIKIPKIKNPKIKIPKIKNSKLKIPKIKDPIIKIPKKKIPKIKIPKIKITSESILILESSRFRIPLQINKKKSFSFQIVYDYNYCKKRKENNFLVWFLSYTREISTISTLENSSYRGRRGAFGVAPCPASQEKTSHGKYRRPCFFAPFGLS